MSRPLVSGMKKYVNRVMTSTQPAPKERGERLPVTHGRPRQAWQVAQLLQACHRLGGQEARCAEY